jgi:hypothetical protein
MVLGTDMTSHVAVFDAVGYGTDYDQNVLSALARTPTKTSSVW